MYFGDAKGICFLECGQQGREAGGNLSLSHLPTPFAVSHFAPMPAFEDPTEALHCFCEAALLHGLAFLFIFCFLCAIGVFWVETCASGESPVMY